MSRLDDIIEEHVGILRHISTEQSKKLAKKEVKELFIYILDTTDVLGPEHPQTNLWYRDLKKKIEEL